MRAAPILGTLLVLLAAQALAEGHPARGERMVAVGPALFKPAWVPAKGPTEVEVKRFLLDEEPVTNAEFLAFVKAHPAWRRDRVPRLFADDGYLGRWSGATSPGPDAAPDAPVTQVSWFAARAYCEARGARLPRENEWELAAAASETARDGRSSPAFRAQLLAWYARPLPERMPAVGGGRANAWGVRDLHGLVWEWVLDFDATFGGSDDAAKEQGLRFCGGQALGTDSKDDYASFMRYAFRSSLEAPFTAAGLGFRCAADAEDGR